MRKLAALLIVLAVSVLGTGEAFGAAKGTDRPSKGSGSGSGTATVVGGEIRFTIGGTLRLSHLGKSTFHVDGVCTNADCSTSNFTNTVVAANGDTLISSGTTTAPAFDFTNQDTITGGTGRFAGASGTSTSTGTIVPDPSNPLAFTITFTSRGTISY